MHVHFVVIVRLKYVYSPLLLCLFHPLACNNGEHGEADLEAEKLRAELHQTGIKAYNLDDYKYMSSYAFMFIAIYPIPFPICCFPAPLAAFVIRLRCLLGSFIEFYFLRLTYMHKNIPVRPKTEETRQRTK
jgi:hypothetical protein